MDVELRDTDVALRIADGDREAEAELCRRMAPRIRLYGLRQLNQLCSLAELRAAFGVGLDELAFVVRLRREPDLRAAVETWLAGSDVATTPAWVEWEQRKHERLLAA